MLHLKYDLRLGMLGAYSLTVASSSIGPPRSYVGHFVEAWVDGGGNCTITLCA